MSDIAPRWGADPSESLSTNMSPRWSGEDFFTPLKLWVFPHNQPGKPIFFRSSANLSSVLSRSNIGSTFR